MLRKSFFVILFFTCIYSNPVRCQEILNFDRLGIDQGLSSSTVLKVIQDREGYLWIATRDGLNRYNGYNFQTFNYRQGDSTSLCGNIVHDVFEDRSGTIWVATSNGVSRFNKLSDTFSQYRHTSDSTSLTSNDVWSIAQDADGGLWFATENAGLNYLRPDAGAVKFQHFFSTPDKNSLISNNLWKVFFDSDGKGWIGSQNGICCIVKSAAGAIRFDRMDNITGLKRRNDVWDIYEDHKKNIWLLSFSGLLDVIPSTECSKKLCDARVVHALDYVNKAAGTEIKTMLSIHEDRSGYLWLGTSETGLLRFKAALRTNDILIAEISQCKKEWNRKRSISDNTIYSICEDAGGNFWIGTSNGLSIYRPQLEKFNTLPLDYYFPELTESAVTAIAGNSRFVFIGTSGKGLLRQDNLSGKLVQFRFPNEPKLNSSEVLSLLEDRKNDLWIGTSDGLYKIALSDVSPNGSVRKVERFYPGNDENSIYSNKIFSLCENDDGKILIGTGMGLNAYDGEKKKIIRLPRAGLNNEIVDENISRFLLKGKAGQIWAGTDNGLFQISNQLEKKRIESIAQGIKINCLFAARDNSLWIGTNGNGVFHLDADRSKVTTYSMANGLPSDVVEAIQQDKDGNLWLATHKGLSKYTSNKFVSYDIHDGLYSNEFMPASFAAADGKLFFGSSKGLNAFYPGSITPYDFVAPLVLTDFKINDESVFIAKDSTERAQLEKNKSVELPFNKNNFAFEFASLNYVSPEKNQYSFKLEGYDKDWVNNGNSRYRNYTNLEHGTYTLRVRTINNSGGWNESNVSYKVTILPPFYKTLWFRIAFIAVLSGLIFFANRARLKTIHLEKEKEFAVKATHMKEQFLANMSHEIRTPLNAIMGMTRLLKEKEPKPTQEKYLNAIMRSSDNLLVIINDILDISKIEAGKIQLEKIPFSVNETMESVYNMLRFKAEEKGLDFSINVGTNVPLLVLGDPVRLSQKLINLTGNAIKFTEKGSVTIKCEVLINADETRIINTADRISLKFDIADTGVGIAPENQNKIFESFTQENSSVTRKFGGTGLGLAITKKLVEMQGGHININSRQGEGTTFSLTIPYEKTKGVEESKLANVSLETAKALLKNCTVLLAEDNEFNQIVAIDTLEQEIEGIKIDVAENGKVALEKVKQNQYYVVLMDVQMPEMNGYDATQAIRALEGPKNKTYIIAMTASALKEEVKRCYDAGMNEYVAKPFNKEELILKMAKVKA
jgi:signal transduction histidine kinase/ligand-binding sensor domain-containing protein/CheY-like chemotaxis protein